MFRVCLAAASTLLVFGGATVAPAWADEDPPPLSQAPAPGEQTTMQVPFSVPVTFTDAVVEAAAYPGVVVAIRYDNPEVTGEYSFGSGVTPAAFAADFLAQYGTTPAATSLVVVTTVPEESDESEAIAGRTSASFTIDVDTPAFVPAPATFAPEVEALFTPPSTRSETEVSAARLAGVSDWRASEAGVEITNYTSNQVDIVQSFWWTESNAPNKVPSGFGVEFEVNMYNTVPTSGVQPLCAFPGPSGDLVLDENFYKRFAAQSRNWNWRVVRPDGVTAPSSLGAYADYNSLGDDCGRGSFALGLRYPQNIQYVNGAYGILFVISAPKGFASTSTISANTQAVSDLFCTTIAGSLMSLTDCMGVYAGWWPSGAGPMSQLVLNQSRGWTAPRKCWGTDYRTNTAGVVTDYTSWMCP